MDQHEIDTELAGGREVLDSASAGHLAYTAKDGTPRVVTVGFYWTGEQFVISTAATAPKVAALSARPDVALVIDDAGTSQQLSVRGRAESFKSCAQGRSLTCGDLTDRAHHGGGLRAG